MSDPTQMTAEIRQMQENIVRLVAGNVTDLHDEDWSDHAWLRIGVNFELLLKDERTSTQALVIAKRGQGDPVKLSFRLGHQARQAFVALAEAMAQGGGAVWTVANLQIERDGRFTFTFDYGKPPRLSGDLLATPLSDFLVRYQADMGHDSV
ncbi:hypothetical protein [Pseudotabrizicola sp. 4114]|uniref:hypothetical protein n=1 Tax=Pseudotabrizicola sp. 4114 TaxID=2817731 RepID=UPI002859D823|nr:hypothetical protein [Pseudorhodobacter sp. 4114]